MGRMSELDIMIRRGDSMNDIATQIQKWNPSIDRRTALVNAYQFMKEVRETND